MEGSKFNSCHGLESNFEDSKISNCDFRYADLRRCLFSRATVNGTNFSFSNVANAIFKEVDITEAFFDETNKHGTIFSS